MTGLGTKLEAYAGRWVAVGEDGVVISAGNTAKAVRERAETARPDENPRIVWISPHPPHVAMPAWPLREVRRVAAGRAIWLAGGPVRDLLLGHPPHDWDFVVVEGGLALARKVADALEGAYYPLDAERGTGRVIIRETSMPAPTEGEHAREPAYDGAEITLDFAELRAPDLRADLAERDFTVNAMALSLDGRLIDPTGGRADLAAGRLRLTHPGAFRDDPARLLRAVRQAHQFGFEFTPETAEQLQADAPLLERVAAERVRDDLVRLMTQERISEALRDLASLGLLPYVLPELRHLPTAPGAAPQAIPTAWDLVRAQVAVTVAVTRWASDAEEQTSESDEEAQAGRPNWMMAALRAELGTYRALLAAYLDIPVANLARRELLPWGALTNPIPERAAEQMTRLRFPNRAIRFVSRLLAAVPAYEELVTARPTHVSQPGPRVTRRQAYRYFQVAGDAGPAGVLVALAMVIAEQRHAISREAWESRLAVARRLLASYFHHYGEVVEPTPLLGGRDLLAMDVPAGPKVGWILAVLAEEQAAGEVTTEEEARAHVRHLLGGTAPPGEAEPL